MYYYSYLVFLIVYESLNFSIELKYMCICYFVCILIKKKNLLEHNPQIYMKTMF